jgi:hypothetical protein
VRRRVGGGRVAFANDGWGECKRHDQCCSAVCKKSELFGSKSRSLYR